jgi:DNA-binding IclR family transcriptional regulator
VLTPEIAIPAVLTHGAEYDRAMVTTEAGGEGSSFDIQSVSRVGQILSLFGPHTTELSAVEVAERLGLNRTTAYRYCASLVSAGMLARGHSRGGFVLGGLMLQLGIHALHRQRVLDLAPSYLSELSRAAGTTAVLSLWGARGPVVALVQEDTSRAVVVTVRPGTQLEMDAAQMRVFLAHHTDHKLIERMMDELDAPRRAEVEAGVYSVRRTGYSLVKLAGGLYGAAAPVFDEHGITAAIALLGAEQVADLSAGSPVLTALVNTAAALSDELSSREGEQQIARQR